MNLKKEKKKKKEKIISFLHRTLVSRASLLHSLALKSLSIFNKNFFFTSSYYMYSDYLYFRKPQAYKNVSSSEATVINSFTLTSKMASCQIL